MNLTEVSIKRPTIIVVIFAALIVLGLYSYTTLNYELIPDINTPNVSVNTFYPGASPAEVENSVTKVIEDAVGLIDNINTINSKSLEGLSIVQIELTQNADVNKGMEDVQRKVNQIISQLPDDCKTPSVNKFSPDDLPIIKIGVFAELSDTEFFDLVERTVQPELSQVEGVAKVDIIGGNEREIQVNLNAASLEKHNLMAAQVSQAINQANIDFPTGKIENSRDIISIRLSGKIASVDLLNELIISKNQNGTVVKLKDVAEVIDSKKKTTLVNRTNGNNSIGLFIIKQADANTVQVSKLISKKLQEIKDRYADKDFDYIVAMDNSTFILDSANAVMFDLFLAIVLVAAVMLLFLHTIRNSLIVMVSIPTSIISTFIMMSVFGFTLNMMTLLALSLVIGILVDDSIVVLENIHRHLEMGKGKIQASYTGRMEIGFTALSITLVDVVVFLPVALASGLAADLLRQYSLVIVTSTLMSLFVSFTLVPYISSRFAKLEHLNKTKLTGKIIFGFERLVNSMIDEVIVLLHWSLKHKFVVLTTSLVMFIASILLIPMGFIGSEFVDAGDRGEFIISMELPLKAKLKETNLQARKIEQVLESFNEIKSFYTTVGKSSLGGLQSASTNNEAEISISLVPKNERNISTDLLSRKLKLILEEKFVGTKFSVKSMNLLGMVNTPVQIYVKGSNFNSVLQYTESLKSIVKKTPGTIEVKTSVEDGKPEYKINVDRDKLKKLGLTISTIGNNLRTAFNGNDDAQFRTADKEYDIHVIYDEYDRNEKSDLENIQFVNNSGELIKLKQFAVVEESSGPTQLERSDRLPSIKIEAGIIGKTVGEVTEEIKKEIKKNGVPEGVAIEFKGESKNQADAFGTLGFALLISIFLVYLVMVALYDSYVYPFVVLFSIPLAIIGALLMLALMNQSLSVFTIVGLIMLVGLVAKNAILVVDFTNQLKAEGKELLEALITSVRLRFRPILMTNISMIIGLLPLALSTSAGSEWKNGLAWALIGGLTSSMVLSMIIVPVIYYSFDMLKVRFGLSEKKELKLDAKITS